MNTNSSKSKQSESSCRRRGFSQLGVLLSRNIHSHECTATGWRSPRRKQSCRENPSHRWVAQRFKKVF